MKVLVINLERSPARLEFMRQQFSSLGVEMERLNGIDGQTLSDADLEWHKSVRSGYHQRTRPQIGCTLSHRLAWKNAAEGGHEWVFICEDDVFIDPLAGTLLTSDSWLPDNIDILKAETTRQKIRTSLFSKNVSRGRRIARLLTNHAGTGGYYLHRNAAQKLLNLTSGNFSEPTDETLFNPFMGLHRIFAYSRCILRCAFRTLCSIAETRRRTLQASWSQRVHCMNSMRWRSQTPQGAAG